MYFPATVKNLINGNSPIQTSISHKRTTIKGQFSFVKNNISSQRGFNSQGLTNYNRWESISKNC